MPELLPGTSPDGQPVPCFIQAVRCYIALSVSGLSHRLRAILFCCSAYSIIRITVNSTLERLTRQHLLHCSISSKRLPGSSGLVSGEIRLPPSRFFNLTELLPDRRLLPTASFLTACFLRSCQTPANFPVLSHR